MKELHSKNAFYTRVRSATENKDNLDEHGSCWTKYKTGKLLMIEPMCRVHIMCQLLSAVFSHLHLQVYAGWEKSEPLFKTEKGFSNYLKEQAALC